MIRLYLLTVVLMLPGCALIDGLGGGSDEPSCAGDCPPLTCVSPALAQIGSNAIDICDQFQQTPVFDCGSPVGDDAVVMVNLVGSGDYEVCLDDGVAGSVQAGESCADGNGTTSPTVCVSRASCTTMFLGGPVAFLTFRTDTPGACGKASFRITPIGLPEPLERGLACLDGVDNDQNGLLDCSDPFCRTDDPSLPDSDKVCQSGLTIERCDGQDNGDSLPGLPPGMIDEFACRCLSDEGCKGLLGLDGTPYLCNAFAMPSTPGGGVCSPDCRTASWCEAIGGQCLMDGRCQLSVP